MANKLTEKPRVPLQLSWLQENDLLDKALPLIEPKFVAITGRDYRGVRYSIRAEGSQQLSLISLKWTDFGQFTLADLADLGFEEGQPRKSLAGIVERRIKDQ